jgi:hypothetical protein
MEVDMCECSRQCCCHHSERSQLGAIAKIFGAVVSLYIAASQLNAGQTENALQRPLISSAVRGVFHEQFLAFDPQVRGYRQYTHPLSADFASVQTCFDGAHYYKQHTNPRIFEFACHRASDGQLLYRARFQ